MSTKKAHSLLITNPKLSLEWHPINNGDLTPDDVTIGSRKKVWWLGSCGHEWAATVKDRTRGYGCPICAGKRVVSGVNDLQSLYPEIASTWHPLKNSGLSPSQITAHSQKKVWWICDKGHEYEAAIDSRTRGSGCPICTGKKVLKGFNDLETQNAFLASEWNQLQNGELKPSNVFPNSHKKVWWKCSLCGHEWKATIDSRSSGNGCPQCSKRMQSSFPEQALYYYINQAFPDAINGYRDIFDRVMELDIFIPSINIGIEYDGKHWHNSEKAKKKRGNKIHKMQRA